MARVRVYLKTFNLDGTYQDDFTDITKYVISPSDIMEGVEDSEFGIGVVRNKGLKLVLRNDKGKFNTPGDLRSLFLSKRRNSIIKLTWDIRDFDLMPGFFSPGSAPLGGEVELFKGLLTEINSESKIDDQRITFSVMGYDSTIDNMQMPFSDVTDDTTTYEDLFLLSLDQSPFNELVTVDAGNISLDNNFTIDDKSDFENTTVRDQIQDMLLAGSAVLYINDDVMHVTDRSASASVKHTFYGQASINGTENMISIPKIRDGFNRMANFWTWSETTLSSSDADSVETYGTVKKDPPLDIHFVTDTSKRQNILDTNRAEFAFPKVELDLIAPMTYKNLGLRILDQVNIDYPTTYVPSDSNVLPRYGLSNYGASRYPFGEFSLTISDSRNFKILNRKISLKNQTITFGLREI